MNLKSFISKINYRLIIIHLLAAVFVILGVKRFAMLYDFEIFELVHKYGKEGFVNYIQNNQSGMTAERLMYSLVVPKIGETIGLLISFLISLIICIKKKIFWLNTIVVFVAAFLLSRFDILDSLHITMLINSFVDLFAEDNLMIYVIVSAVILIGIGSFLFFNKWTNRFIEKSNQGVL